MKKYEFFDVTADIGFIAYGHSLNEAFENGAIAMFNVISNTDTIKKNKELSFTINSEDEVSLLYDFLEELLFLHEVNLMVFSSFNVEISKLQDNSFKLDAKVKGEKINWKTHKRGSEVKAITYHMMDVSCNNGIYEVKTILDL